MTEAEHQERIKKVPEKFRAGLIMQHLFSVKNISESTIRKISDKIRPVEPYEERVRMTEEHISWLEEPGMTEEEFLRRLEDQK